MSVYGRKLTASLLALCLILGLAACGDGGGDSDAERLSGPIYVPEFIELDLELDYVNGGCCDGRYIYILGEISKPRLYNGQGEVVRDLTEEEAEAFWSDPTAGEDGSYVSRANESKLLRVSLDGAEAIELENFTATTFASSMEGEAYLWDLTAGADGTLWLTETITTYLYDAPEGVELTMENMWEYQTSGEDTQIRRQLDSTGSELTRIDAAGLEAALGVSGENVYLDTPILDGEGNFYLMVSDNSGSAAHSEIVVLDSGMNKLFTLELGEGTWGDLSPLGDGTVGLSCSVPDQADPVIRKPVLRVIDPEAKDWGEEYDLPTDPDKIYAGGGDYLFYYENDGSIYGYHAETGEGVHLINWLDAGISASDLEFFTFLEDGQVVVMTRSWDSGGAGVELAVLSEADASAPEEKIVLTYGCMSLDYPGSGVRDAILEFNQTNPKYRVEVRDYSEYNTSDDHTAGLTRLNTELIAGSGPDILDTNLIPIRQYGAKGLLEDLWPYIEADAELGGREALMEHVLQVAGEDGELYQIFSTFSILTAVGATSVVGDRMSWTTADLRSALEAMPEGCQPFSQGYTKQNILSNVLGMNLDSFVDWSTGTCDFDSETFITLLEFCDLFPLEYDLDAEHDSEVTRVLEGRQLLLELELSDLADMQRLEAVFGGDFSFVGYPVEDGGVGSGFMISNGMAMSAACKDKEGAWSFMRELLLPESGEEGWWPNGFYVNRQDFDAHMKKLMTPAYELDENGQPVEVSNRAMGGDGLTVDIYATTQEEYDQFMELYNAIDTTSNYDTAIHMIVRDEAQAFFYGDVTAEDAARQIQNRVRLYLSERS